MGECHILNELKTNVKFKNKKSLIEIETVLIDGIFFYALIYIISMNRFQLILRLTFRVLYNIIIIY